MASREVHESISDRGLMALLETRGLNRSLWRFPGAVRRRHRARLRRDHRPYRRNGAGKTTLMRSSRHTGQPTERGALRRRAIGALPASDIVARGNRHGAGGARNCFPRSASRRTFSLPLRPRVEGHWASNGPRTVPDPQGESAPIRARLLSGGSSRWWRSAAR